MPTRRTGAMAEVRTWLAATPATPTPVMSKRITAEIGVSEVTVADPVNRLPSPVVERVTLPRGARVKEFPPGKKTLESSGAPSSPKKFTSPLAVVVELGLKTTTSDCRPPPLPR